MDKNQYFAEFLISLDRYILETQDAIFKDVEGCYGDIDPLFDYQLSDRIKTLRELVYRAMQKVK